MTGLSTSALPLRAPGDLPGFGHNRYRRTNAQFSRRHLPQRAIVMARRAPPARSRDELGDLLYPALAAQETIDTKGTARSHAKGESIATAMPSI
jgi:hypothetical protein